MWGGGGEELSFDLRLTEGPFAHSSDGWAVGSCGTIWNGQAWTAFDHSTREPVTQPAMGGGEGWAATVTVARGLDMWPVPAGLAGRASLWLPWLAGRPLADAGPSDLTD